MEIVVLILVAFLFVFFRNSISSDIKELTREIAMLREMLLRKEVKYEAPEKKADAQPSFETEKQKPVVPEPEIIQTEIVEEINEAIREEYIPYASQIQEPVKEPEKFQPVSSLPYTAPVAKPSFFEKHPDLEKFIGENLINKIGIAILVLGIAFFVKYAIDKEWINEIGRVGIGILCGGILIGVAHRLRNSFKAFSSVLIGGGLSVLYFTIAIAFHEYKLFSQTTAFGIMVIITGFSISLSVAYDRIELAVLALIGGFSTPFILSTGEGNYKILFTYLLILNCGMLVLAYMKKWNLVNILSYGFTILIYGSWLITKCIGIAEAPYPGALLFGTAFYIIFFLMNVIYNIRNKIEFRAPEIGILLSNTFLYYFAGMSILHYYYEGTYQGVFTALIGVFNFAFAFTFYCNKNIDKNLIFLLIGLVLTFISLTAPVQLEGNYITLFWSAEAVLLLWFSQKSGIRLIRVTSVIVTFLMLVSMLKDWSQAYVIINSSYMIPFLNKIFITGIVSILSVLLTTKLLNNETEKYFPLSNVNIELSEYKNFTLVCLTVLVYFTFMLEMNYQLIHYGIEADERNICLGIYNMIFLSVAFALLKNNLNYRKGVILLIGSSLCLLFYIIKYDFSVVGARNSYLNGTMNIIFFLLHFALALLFAFTIYIFNQMAKFILKGSSSFELIKWITVFLIVYLCSAELNHLVTWMSYSPGRIIEEINKQVSKAGYSVLWGIISLILMQQGMKRKDRSVRIISLSLFFITILKLFIWDLVGISESGKIIAFISLGILLLIVSFMYQRLKKLILENEKNDSVNDEAL